MFQRHLGLTGVPTHLLEKALRAHHRGELSAPVTINGLTAVGLQDSGAELLGTLRALDDRGVRAVLVAVLAERKKS